MSLTTSDGCSAPPCQTKAIGFTQRELDARKIARRGSCSVYPGAASASSTARPVPRPTKAARSQHRQLRRMAGVATVLDRLEPARHPLHGVGCGGTRHKLWRGRVRPHHVNCGNAQASRQTGHGRTHATVEHNAVLRKQRQRGGGALDLAGRPQARRQRCHGSPRQRSRRRELEQTHAARRAAPEAPRLVARVDPDARPVQRPGGMSSLGERRARAVAGRSGCSDHALVVVAVGIGDR